MKVKHTYRVEKLGIITIALLALFGVFEMASAVAWALLVLGVAQLPFTITGSPTQIVEARTGMRIIGWIIAIVVIILAIVL